MKDPITGIDSRYKCALAIGINVPTGRPNVSWWHRCVMKKMQTAKGRLIEQKWTKRHERDKYADQRKLEEQAYGKLKKLTGIHKTRGSWYDSERRAEIKAGYINTRRLGY